MRGAFFVVAGQVVEIFFLVEDVGRIGFFVAGESEEDDGRAELRGETLSAQGVDRGRFALAAGRADDEKRERDDGQRGR
jgi:hypothetical protein